jgi:hypothetical protein
MGPGTSEEALILFCFPFVLLAITLIIIWLWMSANDGHLVNPIAAVRQRLPRNTDHPRYSQVRSSEAGKGAKANK